MWAGETVVAEVRRTSASTEIVAAVQRAVEAPSVFFYGALLDALKAVAQKQHTQTPDEDFENWMEVVELLTFRTIADIDTVALGVKALIALHPIIVEKLRILSLLTLCSHHHMTVNGLSVSYGAVADAVGVTGSIEVQKVVLAAVQHKLCVARLHEQAAVVRVYAYESRNVEANEVAALQARLAEWTAYAEKQLRDIQ